MDLSYWYDCKGDDVVTWSSESMMSVEYLGHTTQAYSWRCHLPAVRHHLFVMACLLLCHPQVCEFLVYRVVFLLHMHLLVGYLTCSSLEQVCWMNKRMIFIICYTFYKGFPGGSVEKNPCANAGDTWDADLIPRSRRSPRVGNGNPLQYSCLENSMDRGAWWATVHGVSRVRHYMLLYLISTAHVYKSNQTFEW